MKNIVKSYIGTIIAVVVLVLTFSVSYIISSGQSASLDGIDAEIASLKSQIVLKEQTVANSEAKAVQAVTGLDKNRTTKDDEIMTNLFEHIFTWDSYESYCAIRTELIEQHDISAGSTFLSQFMPEVVDTTDSTGKHFNRIDVFGLNMAFEKMETYCTYIKGDEYSYAAFVEISSADNMGNTGYNKFMVTYTTDIDGNIFNLDAYAAD